MSGLGQRGQRVARHLRMLPGGDVDGTFAVVVSGTIFVVALMAGGVLAGILGSSAFKQSGAVTGLGLACTVACAAVALATAARIRGSQPIALDEAGVRPERREVFYGEAIARVPQDALLISLQPRRLTTPLRDGRRLTLGYRANTHPDDLLRLGAALRAAAPSSVDPLEGLVRGRVAEPAAEMLPDVAGIREALAADLLELGVVVTFAEAA